jgi:hypothetical protein
VNGRFAGEHEGGNTPFRFDITPYLKTGANTITLRAWDPPTDRSHPAREAVLGAEVARHLLHSDIRHLAANGCKWSNGVKWGQPDTTGSHFYPNGQTALPPSRFYSLQHRPSLHKA